jgi:hypothetical protein
LTGTGQHQGQSVLGGGGPVYALGARPRSPGRDHPRVDEPLYPCKGKLYPPRRRAFEEAPKRVGVAGVGPDKTIGLAGNSALSAALQDRGANAFVGGRGYRYSWWPGGDRGDRQRNGSAAGSATSLPQLGQVTTPCAGAGKVSPQWPHRYTPSDIFGLGCFRLTRTG